MVQLSTQDFRRLTEIVQDLPEFLTARGRYSLLLRAVGTIGNAHPLLSRIDFEGPPATVTIETISHLVKFGEVSEGKEALGAFIEQILVNTGGSTDADFLNELIEKYQLNRKQTLETNLNIIPIQKTISTKRYSFISYASPDQSVAEVVTKRLHKAGLSVFYAPTSITVGANWDISIEQALQETDNMILLLSPSSMPYRKEVHREWLFFDQQKKLIIPLYLQDCVLHSRIQAYNYIDARLNLAAALDKLLMVLSI